MTDEFDDFLGTLAAKWAEVTMPPVPHGAVPEEGWREEYAAGCREEVAAMLDIQRALFAERPWLAKALLPEGWTVVHKTTPTGG